MRWATRMLKVLKMMNAPTTTPMAAKPSSASVKNPRNWRTGLPTSSVASDAVSTSYAGPSCPLEVRLQLLGGHVGVALHVHRVDRIAGVELALRGREVERRDGDRAEVGRVAVAEQADDLVLLGRAAQEDAHAVAHVVAVLLGGARVHRHLARDRRVTDPR